jgi:hypothetical protein
MSKQQAHVFFVLLLQANPKCSDKTVASFTSLLVFTQETLAEAIPFSIQTMAINDAF